MAPFHTNDRSRSQTRKKNFDSSGYLVDPFSCTIPSNFFKTSKPRDDTDDHGVLRVRGRRKLKSRASCIRRELVMAITSLIFALALGCFSVLGYTDIYKPIGRRIHSQTLISKRQNKFLFMIRTRASSSAKRMAISDNGDDSDGADEPENRKEMRENNDNEEELSDRERELLSRMTRLEGFVAKQEVEIQRLKRTCDKLAETSLEFVRFIKLLKDAGLETDSEDIDVFTDDNEPQTGESTSPSSSDDEQVAAQNKIVESFDDTVIFGTAPTSVIDAADSAGAAILAAMLGGKQRMLVDVRDAELSREPETLVQFVELAILPIAAGLEGLKSTRNRVKIVFPKVSQLLEYRRTMALAAPEVVALSTLAFDPVDKRDKLIVILAPAPDDEEGLAAMNELLAPKDPDQNPLQQPVVILNYHMAPVSGDVADFITAYHLRLLTVQYMSGENAQEYFQQLESKKMDDSADNVQESESMSPDNSSSSDSNTSSKDDPEIEDEALEAAMKHAHEVGMNQGITRAMVIRAYPRPWHVFVDTSPDTDSDFEVAATFDKEPTQEELNYAIVECLEGSEREDEIVAQQMQQALEDGQLDRISDMIGAALEKYSKDKNKDGNTSGDDDVDDDSKNDEEDEDEDDEFDMYEEDSI